MLNLTPPGIFSSHPASYLPPVNLLLRLGYRLTTPAGFILLNCMSLHISWVSRFPSQPVESSETFIWPNTGLTSRQLKVSNLHLRHESSFSITLTATRPHSSLQCFSHLLRGFMPRWSKLTEKPFYLTPQCGSLQLGASRNPTHWTVSRDYWYKPSHVLMREAIPKAPWMYQ